MSKFIFRVVLGALNIISYNLSFIFKGCDLYLINSFFFNICKYNIFIISLLSDNETCN